MSDITGAEFVAEVEKKRGALKPGYAVVAVVQNMYPQFGTYTVLTNVEKRRLLALLMERSASKVTGKGKLCQIAFFFERGHRNQIWQRFCSSVRRVAGGDGTKSLGTVTDVSDTVVREIEL